VFLAIANDFLQLVDPTPVVTDELRGNFEFLQQGQSAPLTDTDTADTETPASLFHQLHKPDSPGVIPASHFQVGDLARVIELEEWIDVGDASSTGQAAGVFQYQFAAQAGA